MALTDTTIPPITGIDDPAQARVLLYQAGRPVHAPLDQVGLATDTEMASAIDAAIDATATAETKSRIVNGAMQISQENGNTGTTGVGAAYYLADQWTCIGATSPGVAAAQRVQVTTPNGSKDRIRIAVTTAKAALAAGDYLGFIYPIEGNRVADFRYGLASATQSILRFGLKAPAGTYTVAVRNAAGNRSYLANFTISAGQANTDTEQVLVIPGDITGTWPNDTGKWGEIFMTFACGSTFQAATGWQSGNFFGTAAGSNGLATNGNTFELFDVALHLDPLDTGIAPPWVMPDEAEELRACQRYWTTVSLLYSGDVTNTGLYHGMGVYPVTPRIAAPALTGVAVAAAGFPATIGTLTNANPGIADEYRAANASGVGVFYSIITMNARM